MEYTARKQSNTRHASLMDRGLWLILLLLLTACTRTASTSPAPRTTDLSPVVTVNQVQVTQGTGIYVSGTSTIPEGECIKTELQADEQALAWWPRDICVEVGAGRWELLVSLGRDGAPDQLDPAAQYAMRAWWPANPEATATRFPFDLQGPPQP